MLIKAPMLSKFISIFAIFMAATGVASANGDIYVTLTGGGEAEIFIDGEPTGESTPATLRDVTAGNHDVSARGSCGDATQTVTVTDDMVSPVELNSPSGGGFVEINVSPENANVFIDEEPIGVGPYLAMEVACGGHQVRVTALQHQPKTETFELSSGQAIRLDITLLQSGSGSVSVLVTPIEAVVLLDGTRVSQGPLTIDNVPPGEHRIGAMLDGFVPIDEPISINSGEVTEVELILVADQIPMETEDETDETSALFDPTVTTTITTESIAPTLPTGTLPTGALPSAMTIDWRDYTAAAMVTTSLVTGYLGWKTWSDVTMVRYNNYVTQNNDRDYYNEQVMPAWGLSVGLAAVSGISLLTGSYFLFYDDKGATSIGLSGRF